jgi:hypothetical protein
MATTLVLFIIVYLLLVGLRGKSRWARSGAVNSNVAKLMLAQGEGVGFDLPLPPPVAKLMEVGGNNLDRVLKGVFCGLSVRADSHDLNRCGRHFQCSFQFTVRRACPPNCREPKEPLACTILRDM